MTFDNNEVRAICEEVGFGNHFDVTKIDRSAALPEILQRDDVFVVHLGREGNQPTRHQFVSGIANGYHAFEPIPEDCRRQWSYQPSILNNINTSESNTLSMGYNQRIIHAFLYGDTEVAPKVYGSNRTKIPLDYRIGNERIDVSQVQVEIDLTMEYEGEVTVFEAKNGTPSDFNIFQLFNPFRYYRRATQEIEEVSIQCCYLVRRRNRLRLYLYAFDDPQSPGSIRLLRNAEYNLVPR